MKNLILLLFSLVLFGSCSLIEEPEFNISVDKNLEEYLEIYQDECYKRGVDWNPNNISYQIKITDNLKTSKGRDVAGLATTTKRGVLIEVDKDHFDRFSSSTIERIVMHEALHAFHNYPHVDDKYNVMYHKSLPNIYRQNREKVLNITFKRLQ